MFCFRKISLCLATRKQFTYLNLVRTMTSCAAAEASRDSNLSLSFLKFPEVWAKDKYKDDVSLNMHVISGKALIWPSLNL